MKCTKARELFSPFLDGELAPHEAGALEAHLAACAACRGELAVWKRLSAEVRGLREDARAPEGFAQRVMQQVPVPQRNWLARLGGSFKRGLAVAAAFGVILAGAVGYAAFRWLGGGGAAPYVADHRPTTVAENKQGIDKSGGLLPATLPGSNPVIPPQENRTDNKRLEQRKPTSSPPAAGTSQYSEPRAFLASRERIITRTLLRVAVVDADKAAARALALAGAAGAELVDFSTQPGNVFQTYTIEKEKAPAFCGQLAALGYLVIPPQEQTEDLTAAYVRDLERYRSLLNQAGAADDPEDRKRLEQQAKAVEAELVARDREASRQVVVLWLEQKQ